MTLASPLHSSQARITLWTIARLLSGWLTLAVLAYFMWSPGDWPIRLFIWILLTLLADEFAGWFGYIAIALGALAFFSPYAPPEQWFIIVPLLGCALFATLIVKHSGGLLVLPFAAALFIAPLFAAEKLSPFIDPSVTLFGNAQFKRMALLAMGIGLTISVIRHIVTLILKYRAKKGLSSSLLPPPRSGVRRSPTPVQPKVQFPSSNAPSTADLDKSAAEHLADTNTPTMADASSKISTSTPTIRTNVVPPSEIDDSAIHESPTPPKMNQDFVVDIQLPSDDQPTPPPQKEQT